MVQWFGWLLGRSVGWLVGCGLVEFLQRWVSCYNGVESIVVFSGSSRSKGSGHQWS